MIPGSAGCNATVICTTMAEQWGKVAIDLNSPDNAMSPDCPEYWLALINPVRRGAPFGFLFTDVNPMITTAGPDPHRAR